MNKVIKKNDVVMDSVTLTNTHHVLVDGKEVYTCTLNRTNIKTNNKYYILQLPESDIKKEFTVYTHNRIGDIGVIKNYTCQFHGLVKGIVGLSTKKN